MRCESDESRSGAWLKAARQLLDEKERIYNLVVEVRRPSLATASSRAIEARVEAFLAQHGCQARQVKRLRKSHFQYK